MRREDTGEPKPGLVHDHRIGTSQGDDQQRLTPEISKIIKFSKVRIGLLLLCTCFFKYSFLQ